MLSGSAPTYTVQSPSARFTSGSRSEDVMSWSVERDLGLVTPGSDDAQFAAGEGTVQVGPTQSVVVSGKTPWKTGADRSLAPYAPARLEASPVSTHPYRPALTGVVDKPSAGDRDGHVTMAIKDAIDPLLVSLRWEPLLRKMPPLGPGGPYRYVGLCNAYVVDRAMRAGGFNTTPPPDRGTTTALWVPAVGSLWPQWGYMERSDGPAPVPTYRSGMPQGVVLKGVSGLVQYRINEWNTSLGNFEIAIDVDTSTTTTGLVKWWIIDGEGQGKGYVIQYSQATRGLSVWHAERTSTGGLQVPSGESALVAVTLTDKDYRGVIRIRRYTTTTGSPEVEVRTKVSGKHVVSTARSGSWVLNETTGWRAICSTTGDAVLGAFLVDNPATPWAHLDWEPNASLGYTYGSIDPMTAMPRMQGDQTALDLLTGFARAEYAACGFDENGTLYYRTREYLKAQPLAKVIYGEDLISMGWTDESGVIRSGVALTYTRTNVIARRYPTVTAWRGSGDTLETGEDGEVVMSPDGDVDWVKPDLDFKQAGINDPVSWNLGRGSWWGATRAVDPADGDPYDQWAYGAPGDRIWSKGFTVDEDGTTVRWTYSVSGSLQDAEVVELRTPETKSSALRRQGVALPWLRCYGSIKRLPITMATRAAGVSSAPVLEHDVDWYVQDYDARVKLIDWLVAAVSSSTPVVRDVRIAPDLRLQIGDRVRVMDTRPGGTGADVEGLITRKHLSGSPDGIEMVIDLMEIS